MNRRTFNAVILLAAAGCQLPARPTRPAVPTGPTALARARELAGTLPTVRTEDGWNVVRVPHPYSEALLEKLYGEGHLVGCTSGLTKFRTLSEPGFTFRIEPYRHVPPVLWMYWRAD